MILEEIIRQVEVPEQGQATRSRLLVALARPEAEADPVAVAEMAAVDPLVGHAAALVGRIVGIAAADLSAVGFPQPVNHQACARENCRAVGQMHGAQCLAGERAWFPASRTAARRRARGGIHRPSWPARPPERSTRPMPQGRE